MILDSLDQFHKYVGLNPYFATAMDVLNRPDLDQLPVGRFEVDGERVYAVIAQGPGRKPGEGHLETHDDYIDIHYVLNGTDLIGWKSRKDLSRPRAVTDPRQDVRFWDDEPEAWTQLSPGMFAIHFPEDAHLPMVSYGDIHKVIVKVSVQ